MRRYAFLLFFFALIASGYSDAGKANPAKETLIVATNAGPVDLDPHGTNDQNTNDVRYQIYEPLVNIDVDGKVLPGLATAWKWIDDTTIDFTIREGVKFHNGKKLKPEDVLYSFKRALTNEFTSSYLANIMLDRSSVLKDGKVELKLKVPVSALLSRLSRVMIINEETWTQVPEKELLSNPVGTGPYKFTKWVEGDRLEFDAFPDYWGGAAPFKKLVMRIIPEAASRALEIEAGSVDVALSIQASNVEILEKSKDIKLYSTPCYMITYMGFDANVAPYNKKEVRQALSYALNREAIAKTVYSGLGTPALFGRMSEVYWGYTESGMTKYPYNPGKAKELLAKAGYPNGFSMNLSLSEAEKDQIDMSEIIQSQLKNVGIKVKIDIIENATFLNTIVNGGFDTFLLNSVGYSADPGEALKSFIASRPTWSNTTRYKNDKLTALIEKGQATIKEDAKFAIFKEAQQIIADELPWIFLIHNRVAFATRSSVGGIKAYPSRILFFKEARPAN